MSHVDSADGSEDFLCVCYNFLYALGKNLKLLPCLSIMYPWQLWEIFFPLNKPAAADFGFRLIHCIIEKKKEDAQLL